ncbi:hypothetical protein MS3_00000515 [Schistosoma haematobium]|uniref:Uncharacterized protein n=1 Tax=Schistosoma haematobium TaxID=6185 RepID=A0A922LGU6_SCHHA|nr:hypothetical protein MS3_00000515 [Schistosoma haematobium]KAH9583965.1 hypothetical protein MS3_00000515 [Schistosoma haematobium]
MSVLYEFHFDSITSRYSAHINYFRYIPPFALLISVYLVVTLLCDIYNCQDICQQPELEKYEKVIFVNATYKYTHYYKYSQRIRTNQSNPVVNATFETFNTRQKVRPKFQFQLNGRGISDFHIRQIGLIAIEGDITGLINHIMPGTFLPQFEMLHNGEFYYSVTFSHVLHTLTLHE